MNMNSEKTGPVDVLAVVKARCPDHVGAAVAELVEAARFARYTARRPTGYSVGADRRLAAALAKFGGAA